MSNKTQKSIVTKIQAMLKLGDAGKLESFFNRIEKRLKRDIQAHQKNIEAIRFAAGVDLESLQDKMEDAKQELEDKFLDVNIEEIGTNSDQEAYMGVYLKGVKNAQNRIQSIEDNIKELEDDTSSKIEAIQEAIDSLQSMLDSINGK